MPLVRPGAEHDLDPINEIHGHYAENTHVSFDERAYTVAERRRWFRRFDGPKHRLFVVEDGGEIAGYTHSLPWRPKAAYRYTVETTILLRPEAVGAGLGTLLYEALMAQLAADRVHRACAVIALPNGGSVAFHRRFGFRSVGVLTAVGHKDGRWWDTELMEREFDA